MARRKKRGDAKLLTLDRRTGTERAAAARRTRSAVRMRSSVKVEDSVVAIRGFMARIVPHLSHALK
jgi:hypothetical protein